MKIEFFAPDKIRITWPQYDAAIEAQIAERLRSVPGIEGFGHRWSAPVIQTVRLMELFPKASYDYAALSAADKATRNFYDSMVRMGIELALDASGAVCAVGEGISPLLQQLIDERAHALKPLVVEAMRNPRPRRQQPQGAWQGPLTVEDAKFEPLLKGIENARKKAAEQEIRYPKRRRTKKARVA